MSNEKRQQLKDIFDAALQQKSDQRQRFVNEKCGADETLRVEIESLLFSFDSAENFMQDAAIGVVAEFIVGGNNPASGKCFGHYEIVKQIGVGGMGEVYLAKDTKLDRFVALKILNENFSQHEINRSRFIQEAKAASGLNHPNILVIHEIGEAEGIHFIVSEYIEGKTLREILGDAPLNLSIILDISIQIANALATAHEAHLVHRDIKPENIMVRPDGFVKILDFGLAKLVEQKTSISGLTNEIAIKNETAKGIILGTFNYMSPEQAKGERVDARTDIFSLGVVIYEMIAGQTPFGCESVSETWTKLLHLELTPISHLVPQISDELEIIIGKMLRKNKVERYQTVRELLVDLRDFRKRLEFETELERTSPPNKSPAAQTEVLEVETTAAHERINFPPNNLTEFFSPIIGREKEIAEIQDLLRRTDLPLLTLTGIGGTGKTKLAKAVARELLPDFKDGVFFVEIAAITNPELVALTIAQPLGVNEAGNKPVLEALKNFLHEKNLLLVVDNFEQVIDAAPIIAELIAAAKGLKILITSRVLLHLSAEREFVVSPLAVPSEFSQISLEEFSKYEAINLFVERAQKAKPSFALTEENARCVAEICARLDGLPLAIELAAARIKILSSSAILAKLENRLKLLTGGARDLPARQQTMRGAVTWSYDLLSEVEKYLFRRLAVFAGGFTFEAAESVVNCQLSVDGKEETSHKHGTADDEQLSVEVLDGITSLVEQSLLLSKEQANGTIRFRMLEVVREYALETLKASGEAEILRRSHVVYFLMLGEEAEPHLLTAQSVKWLNRLEEEHDNLRAALTWSLDYDVGMAVRLAASLRNLWIFRCHLTEGRRWLEAAFELSSRDDPSAVRFKLLNGLGVLVRFQGDYETARKAHEAGLAMGKAANDGRQIAQSIRNLGAVAHQQGDFTAARKFLEEGLAISRELDDKFRIAESLNALGDLARVEGDNAAARPLFEESLAICKQLGRSASKASNLLNLGAIAFGDGDFSAARLQFAEALTTAQEIGDKIIISCTLDGFAALAGERGEPREATRLAGAVECLRETIGYKIESAERQFRNAYLKTLHTSLGEEEFNLVFEQGRKLRMEEILALIELQF